MEQDQGQLQDIEFHGPNISWIMMIMIESQYLTPSTPRLVPRLGFLKCLLDDWCQQKGLQDLRACPKHTLLGDVSVDPTEESVASLFEPIAMVLAQFGVQLPFGSKFKVL